MSKWSTIRRELGYRSRIRLYELAKETLVTYARMSCTVVVAVVIRLCLDCIGIISTGQNPAAVVFWFAHCQQDGQCVMVALFIFFLSLCGSSLFGWSCQDWIVDPARNPYANRFSFKILVDAASWVPISVVVGKTNALVEWGMASTQDDLVQMFISEAIAAILTLVCALLTHISMKHCRGVAGYKNQAQVKEAGFAGFGKYIILNSLICLAWAVGWSNWTMVMALMDALEPGRSVHSTALAVGVISMSVVCTSCFYLRYGPEPVIPDPLLQELCYRDGYSSSLRRSFMSYLVYSCMIFIVMCCVDPTYGLLHVVAEQLTAQLDPSAFDTKALLVLIGICLTVTVGATLCSVAITRFTRVDMESSMKLSRSAYEVRLRMTQGKRSDAELLGYEQMMRDAGDGLDGAYDDFPESKYETPQSPRCDYSALGFEHLEYGAASPDDIQGCSTENDPLYSIVISRGLCASVLIYDVLAFAVCGLWGTLAIRFFVIVFGHLASMHSALYILSSFTYAALTILVVLRVCFACFPSAEEIRQREAERDSAREIIEVAPTETFFEPFLEMPEIYPQPESENPMA